MTKERFFNIDISEIPPEAELLAEMRCREIMKSDDIDGIKQHCIHLIKHQIRQDAFLSSMLDRLVELEALLMHKRLKRSRSTNNLKKFFHIP